MSRLGLGFCVLFVLIAWSTHLTSAAVQSTSLGFPNGGFEEDNNTDGKPDLWGWPKGEWGWDGSVSHSGARSARISRFGGATTDFLWSPNLLVKPSTTYTLSFWMRTLNASKRPTVDVLQYNSDGTQLGPSSVIYVQVSGTTNWHQTTFRFQTTPDTSYVRVCLYLTGSQTGTFWFDDFSLQEGAPALFPFQPGFPVKIDGWIERSSPTVADLNRDGHNELLIAGFEGRVYAWTAAGSLLSGYPLVTGGNIFGHLAVGDLNGDGDLEVVAGVGSDTLGEGGKVYIWQHDGTLFPGWPKTVHRHGTDRFSRISTVILADIDNDSDLEVIAGTNNNDLSNPDPILYVPNLYAWHHDGQLVDGNWPVEDEFNVAILGTIAAGDLNSDDQTDIIAARDYHRLFAYGQEGNDLSGWPIFTFAPENGNWRVDPYIVHRFSAPTLADLDWDGVIEYIVAGVRRPPDSATVTNNDLLVLQPDGTRRPGWETPATGVGLLSSDQWMQQAPAIGDLDGDNWLDIVVPTQDGWIRAYTADKTLLWSFNYAQGKPIYASEPVIGDVDTDGLNEVIFGTYDLNYGAAGPVGLWILENDGVVKSGAPLPVGTPGILPAPTLTDLDGDGDLEIVAATSVGMVYVWDTPARFFSTRLPWPTARHDIQRTAFFTTDDLDPVTLVKTPSVTTADQGEVINYTLRLMRSGPPLTHTVYLTDVIPTGLGYIAHTLTATSGTTDETVAPTLRWSGLLSETNLVEIAYAARVTESSASVIINSAIANAGIAGQVTSSATVIVNGKKAYLPVLLK